MAYEKLGFVDGVTPLDAAHFNHMEEGIANPDWNQMQNKPFYKHYNDTIALPESEVVGEEMDGLFVVLLDFSLFASKEYLVSVTFDGVSYDNLSAVDAHEGSWCYGNTGFIGAADSGEPFMIMTSMLESMAVFVMQDNNPHTVSVTVRKPVYYQMDNNYLPCLPLYADLSAVDSVSIPYLYKNDGSRATCADFENAMNNVCIFVGMCVIFNGTFAVVNGRVFPLECTKTVSSGGTYYRMRAYYGESIRTFYTAEYTGT